MNQETKYYCLEFAIKSGAGTSYNEAGSPIIDVDKIIEAAKKFEAYYAEKDAK